MQRPTLAVAANFTAEPVTDSVAFWLRGFGVPSDVAFAPFDQVFQQLLDPSSLLGTNRSGADVVLLRLDLWLGQRAGADDVASLDAKVEELASAVRSAAGRVAVPLVVAPCPAAPATAADPARAAALTAAESRLVSALRDVASVQVLTSAELLVRQGAAEYWDEESEAIGAIPYTETFFATLGTALARRIRGAIGVPYKVVVLDCDNTLWRGVVGELGPLGVEVDATLAELQRAVVRQHEAGMLVCLCSKNNEADVRELFDKHPHMALSWSHVSRAKVNWEPKSENLRALAAELGLGLSSFVFIDDSAYEIAEVRRSCPEVLALQLPSAPEDIRRFVEHAWFFDRATVTAADRLRAASYAQNAQREDMRQRATSLDDFLRDLDLRVEIRPPRAEDMDRAAQMTQRTNQFNLSTVRRTAPELTAALASGALQARVVDVRDRFGDYGTVGLLLFEASEGSLRADTFLLSCRALGRRVEHRMLAHLGEVARDASLTSVVLPFVRSAKNTPALRFLTGVTGEDPSGASEHRFVVTPEEACAAPDRAAAEPSMPEPVAEDDARPAAAAAAPAVDVELVSRLYTELYDPHHLVRALRASRAAMRDPSAARTIVAPRNDVERALVEIWKDVLHDDRIGVTDNFFDLGGNSLAAVPMFARLRKRYHVALSPTTLLDAPTIAQLAQRVSGAREGTNAPGHRSLLAIQRGGSRAPLFVMHAGAGTIFIYHHLAAALGPDQPVYGLQVQGLYSDDRPHRTIEEMASDYLREMRTVQPVGPYRLAGFCLGATIALEVALQLERSGEEVTFLGSFDGAAPGYRGGARKSSFAEEASQRLRIRVGRRIDRWRNRLLMRYTSRRNTPIPQIFQRASWYFTVNNLFAKLRYVPAESFRGRLHVFTIKDRYADPTIGWARWAAGGVVPYEIPGEFRLHRDLMRPPMVERVAALMSPLLDGRAVEPLGYREVERPVPVFSETSAPTSRPPRGTSLDDQSPSRI